MKKRKLTIIIISLLFILVPFFINVYSFYKIIVLLIGIIGLDIGISLGLKKRIFFLIYFPLVLLVFIYSVDYIKTYTLKISPIFVWENKINKDVSIYSSLFYRVFKCEDNYVFDNDYQESFVCDTKLLEEMNINKILNEPDVSFKDYKNDFIKITGKISKISGASSIEMKEYTVGEGTNSLNGYVKFNETSKLIVNLKGINISQYKIYDYITVVGRLNSFNVVEHELTLTDTVVEENNLYDNFDLQVILNNKCSEELVEYTDNFYTRCIQNIFVDYKIDKYELSYALKDKKIIFDDLIKKAIKKDYEGKVLYELEKFDILVCSIDKNILLSKDEQWDVTICDREILEN